MPDSAIVQDLKFALRTFRRQPGFCLVALLTLGVGIGANTAIFSVVHAVVFEPLRYKDPERLVRFYTRFPSMKFDKFWVSPPEFLDLGREATSFESVGAWVDGAANLVGGREPVRVSAAFASGRLLETIGVPVAQGRLFGDEATLPGAPPVLLVGHGLWQRVFGGDPGIVGKTVHLDGTPTTIIGVLPRDFDFPSREVEVWAPLTLDPANPGGRSSHYLSVVGRLRPEASVAKARAELDSLMAQWADTHKEHPVNARTHPMTVESLHEEMVGDQRPRMMTLLGAVGFVLLIACANVANLLLARAEARHKEIAVRTAMGASRGRLIRQFLVESVLLGLGGGALGLVFGRWALGFVLAIQDGAIPRVAEIGIDGRVLAFTLAVSLFTGLLFGLAPALHVGGGNLQSSLKASGQKATAGAERQLFRSGLVVIEIALAVMLVLGSGLLIRSFTRLLDVKPGFEPQGLVTFELSLPQASYPEASQVADFYERLRERLGTVPGVEAATLVAGLPPDRPVNANDIVFEGMARQDDGPVWNVDFWQVVGDGYFKAMRIPLREGRFLQDGDAAGTTPVALVNETMARKFWPGQSPVGRRVQVTPGRKDTPWVTVVGVVGDVKQQGLAASTGTEIYLPMRQLNDAAGFAPRDMFGIVRSATSDPLAVLPSVRAAVASLDASLPVANVRTMEQVFGRSVARPRFLMTLLLVFAAVALFLAAIGIYGVLSYAVAERTNEIGIRMALGADRSAVLRLVVGQAMTLAGTGVALGLVGSAALSRLLASLLFGVTATDPLTFALVPLLLALVALAASTVPAARAIRVDPMVALRYE